MILKGGLENCNATILFFFWGKKVINIMTLERGGGESSLRREVRGLMTSMYHNDGEFSVQVN